MIQLVYNKQNRFVGICQITAMYFSTEAWVNFKLWGYAFPVIFIVGQGFYISRYLSDDDSEASKS